MTLTHSNRSKFTPPQSAIAIIILMLVAAYPFGMMYSSLTIYLQSHIGKTSAQAVSLFSDFSSWLYGLAVIGGLIGAWLGHRSCTIFGFICLGASALLMGLSSHIYLSMALFVIGAGFFTPNFSVFLGQVFGDASDKRYVAYLALYMVMNLGVMASSFAAGYLVKDYGFKLACLGTVFFMVASIIGLIYIYPKLPFQKTSFCYSQNQQPLSAKRWSLFLVCFAAFMLPMVFLIQHPVWSDWTITGIMFFASLFLLFHSFSARSHLPHLAQKKLRLFLVLMLVTLIFWVVYNLNPSLLMMFADKGVDRHFFGHLIPAQSFESVGTFFNIIIGFVLVGAYFILKRSFSPSQGILLGVFSVAIGYGVFALSSHFISADGLVSIDWFFGGAIFLSIAEMLISPMCYSISIEYGVGWMQGVLIGFFQLVTGAGATLADFLVRHDFPQTAVKSAKSFNLDFAHFGVTISIAALVIAVLSLLILPVLYRRTFA